MKENLLFIFNVHQPMKWHLNVHRTFEPIKWHFNVHPTFEPIKWHLDVHPTFEPIKIEMHTLATWKIEVDGSEKEKLVGLIVCEILLVKPFA